MNDIQLFTNELFGNVRSIELNGQFWFVGSDIANCLGYSNPQKAIRDHVDSRDKMGEQNVQSSLTIPVTDSLGRTQYPIWINESGLYSLIFSSKLPSAVEFKYWVTSVVLPTMRQIGFNRSMEVLQNENLRLQNENKYLNSQLTTAGEINTANSISNMDNMYSVYYILNNPYISDDVKRAMLTCDIPDVDIDLKKEINKKAKELLDNYEQEV